MMKTKTIIGLLAIIGVAVYADLYWWNNLFITSYPNIKIIDIDYNNHVVRYNINDGEIKTQQIGGVSYSYGDYNIQSKNDGNYFTIDITHNGTTKRIVTQKVS